MKYERKFYTEEAAVWKAAESTIEKLELHRSAAQKAKDQLTNTLEAEQIINRAEEQQKSRSNVIDLNKTKCFNELAQKAIDLAEAAPLDISINTDDVSGQICLSGDSLMVMKSSPQVLRDVYLELCKDAETWSVTNNAAGLIEFVSISRSN